MPPALARLLALIATCVAVALGATWSSSARADDDAPALAPHDVGEVVQPAGAPLGAPPADFQRIDAGWLTVEFPGSVRDRATELVADAESFRARLAVELGQPVLDHVQVRIARDPEQMAALAPLGAPPFSYASAMAYPSVRLAILSMKAPRTWEGTDLIMLSRHELMHLALSDAVGGHHVPRWFDEGLAIHESGEQWSERLGTLWQATLAKTLLPFPELDRGFAEGADVNVAYAESADVVRFLMRDDDRARFGSLVQRLRAGTPFDRALGDAYDTDLRKLEYEWREEVSHRFGLVPLLTGGGALWALTVMLAGVAWVKRRRRAKAKLEQWAQEEAEMDAAAEAARERLEREKALPGTDEDDIPAQLKPGVPVVEHDGRWHILH